MLLLISFQKQVFKKLIFIVLAIIVWLAVVYAVTNIFQQMSNGYLRDISIIIVGAVLAVPVIVFYRMLKRRYGQGC